MAAKTPKAPSGLGTRGRAYWSHVMGEYELTESETHVLLEVCRTLDNLDRLAESIDREGAMVTGSKGQKVLNPAMTEARGQRLALHRLIAALRLPDDEGESIPQRTHSSSFSRTSSTYLGDSGRGWQVNGR